MASMAMQGLAKLAGGEGKTELAKQAGQVVAEQNSLKNSFS